MNHRLDIIARSPGDPDGVNDYFYFKIIKRQLNEKEKEWLTLKIHLVSTISDIIDDERREIIDSFIKGHWKLASWIVISK